MRIQVAKTREEFVALKQHWDPLLSQSGADTVFLTWEWLSSWWESYAHAGDALHIIQVYDDADTLAGILPLFLRKRKWLPFRKLKVLQFVGQGSWDSDYLDAIVKAGREEEVFSEVWHYLRSNKGLWDVMELAGVPEGSATLQWLKQVGDTGDALMRSESVPCAVARLPGSWDEYLTLLKPRFRTKIRSTLCELEEKHNVRFYSIESAHDLAAGLETLFDLHGRRWKLKGHEGVFQSAEKRRFYHSFASECVKLGWLAFDFLELDGNVVACQLCFRYKGIQFLLQEGFDPEFASESVGIALRAMVFRRAIESGVESYDFLAGVGRHKTQWGGQLKGSQNVAVGRKGLHGRLYVETPVFVEVAKERVKAFLPTKAFETLRRLHQGFLKAQRAPDDTGA